MSAYILLFHSCIALVFPWAAIWQYTVGRSKCAVLLLTQDGPPLLNPPTEPSQPIFSQQDSQLNLDGFLGNACDPPAGTDKPMDGAPSAPAASKALPSYPYAQQLSNIQPLMLGPAGYSPLVPGSLPLPSGPGTAPGLVPFMMSGLSGRMAVAGLPTLTSSGQVPYCITCTL